MAPLRSDMALVLLSGPIAVGKTSVRDALEKAYGFACIRSSSYLRDLAKRRELHGARGDLQELGDELDRRTDFRWVVEDVARPIIEANPGQKRWLFDAVRKQRQVEHFRAAYGPHVHHVHLWAPDETLRLRYEARLTTSGDQTSYAMAIAHDNETCARALTRHADVRIQADYRSPYELAAVIVRTLSLKG